MRFVLLALTLALPVLAATNGFARRWLDDTEPCPRTLAEWHEWTRKQSGKFEGDTEVPMLFERCAAELAAVPAAKQCTGHLNRYDTAQHWRWILGHDLGMATDDVTYYRNPPYPGLQEMPAELQAQDFLGWLSTGEFSDEEKALARIDAINQKITDPKLKWIAFKYMSVSVPSLDGVMGRFFVYVPGQDFDRYLQFAMPKAAACSIVAVQKTDPKTHQPLAVPQVRLTDLWRNSQNDGRITISVNVLQNRGTENCYRCHKEPVLAIHPSQEFDTARFGQRLAAVNRQIQSYGRTEISGLDMGGYGPPLGPEVSSVRTEALFKQCAAALEPDEVAKVKDAMSCARCHDGDTRAVLNYPVGQNEPLLEIYLTKHRIMPPGHPDLTAAERSALLECLHHEYYDGDGNQPGLLSQWLADEPCWQKAD